MLSYVHAFHAGNFADVHKHTVLTLSLEYLCRKSAPLALFDFYAGAGVYDLQDAQARKTAESDAGIGLLWPHPEWPPVVAGYGASLSALNAGGLRSYPGSPELLIRLSREQDSVVLVELHPAAYASLQKRYGKDSRVHLHRRDAHEAIRALLPPSQPRGLVLLDPSYEGRDEFSSVSSSVRKALPGWRHGVWCIWYPLLTGNPHRPMVDSILREAGREVLVSELRVPVSGDRMHGSGMLVINPPYVLREQLDELGTWFAGLGAGAATLKNKLHQS